MLLCLSFLPIKWVQKNNISSKPCSQETADLFSWGLYTSHHQSISQLMQKSALWRKTAWKISAQKGNLAKIEVSENRVRMGRTGKHCSGLFEDFSRVMCFLTAVGGSCWC